MTLKKLNQIKRDLVGGLIVAIMPCLFFSLIFFKDIYSGIKKSHEIKTISYETQRYGYYPKYEEKEVGSFYVIKTTAYCPCVKCCGWSTGITCSGTVATEGRTVGANLTQFPLETELIIDGQTYIVEDTGHIQPGTIDIYMDSHEKALQYGVQYKLVVVNKE